MCRRKNVRGCATLVDIRTCIENDRLVTSLDYCAIYAKLLVLRALGGASYRTGIILVVVRMAAPPATTSSALAHDSGSSCIHGPV